MDKSKLKTFAIIGGDKRYLYAANAIIRAGYNVALGGFDNVDTFGVSEVLTAKEAAEKADVIILPITPVTENKEIFAPLSKKSIYIDDDLTELIKDKIIFCGFVKILLQTIPKLSKSRIYEYNSREDLAIHNAIPTAEGAIEIAMKEFEGTIYGSKCLVCGFGRIGKVLSDFLKGMHADVTVSARKTADIALASVLGHKTDFTNNLINLKKYELIFNTVPSMVFNEKRLMQLNEKAIIIDLASKPGGVDFEVAKKLNITVNHALSLPGKCAPKTAGEIIKNTIFTIIDENAGGNNGDER